MLETPVFMRGLGTPLEMAGLMLEMDRREGWGVALRRGYMEYVVPHQIQIQIQIKNLN